MNETLSQNADELAPIFIVGPPRCGTTLVAEILGAHPNLFFPSETHFYEEIRAGAGKGLIKSKTQKGDRALDDTLGLFRKYQYEEDWKRVETPGFREQVEKSWEEQGPGLPNLFHAFMSLQAQNEGKLRWGDNTPRDVFHLKQILTDFPNARILICSRDPRDFLLSYQNKWKKTWHINQSRIRALYHPLTTTLLWKSSMRQLEVLNQNCPQENWMLVRYEDIVANPEETVREICKTTGIKFHSELLDVKTNNSSFESKNAEGIFRDSVGRWRKDLPREESWFPERFAKNEMRLLNYPTEGASDVGKPSAWKLLRQFMRFPFALLSAIRSNRSKIGPLVPYLLRRVAPMLRRP
ncbi:MAG TPA: hypothetical protein DDW23_00585 [Planctomycetes bacterium]|nr:hypothetical protein [Planctomycetota bacterium]